MRLTIFFISRTKKVEAKTLAVLKVYSNKGNVFLLFHFFEILLKSAITCKQILLHGNGIVQYLQNYKWPKFNQNHFRKPRKVLQTPRKATALTQPMQFSLIV